MKRRALRAFVLLWLGWYLSGPAAEMVDFWDTPAQEMQDVVFHGSGVLTVIAVAFYIGAALVRKLQQLCKALVRTVRAAQIAMSSFRSSARIIPVISSHGVSPPIPLRV